MGKREGVHVGNVSGLFINWTTTPFIVIDVKKNGENTHHSVQHVIIVNILSQYELKIK